MVSYVQAVVCVFGLFVVRNMLELVFDTSGERRGERALEVCLFAFLAAWGFVEVLVAP